MRASWRPRFWPPPTRSYRLPCRPGERSKQPTCPTRSTDADCHRWLWPTGADAGPRGLGDGPPVFFHCGSRRRHRLRRAELGPDLHLGRPHISIAELYDALGKPGVVTIEKEHVDIALMEGTGLNTVWWRPPPRRSACLSAPRQGEDAAAITGHHDRPFHLAEDAPALIDAVNHVGLSRFREIL